MRSIIEVKNLNYKDLLHDITFSIEEGTFNLLIGQGKTTLINEIINSKEVHKSYKRLGYIPEKLTFITKTPMEELLFVLDNLNYRKRESEKIIYDISDKLDIGYMLNKEIKTLNQTEKLLISIAAILICSPDLIIIDNSLDYLDNKTRKKIIKMLKEYTVLMTSYNEEDISISDKIIILGNHELIFNGTKEELYDNEKLLLNNNYKLPFMIDLSKKLMVYNLLDHVTISKKEIVDKIWN